MCGRFSRLSAPLPLKSFLECLLTAPLPLIRFSTRSVTFSAPLTCCVSDSPTTHVADTKTASERVKTCCRQIQHLSPTQKTSSTFVDDISCPNCRRTVDLESQRLETPTCQAGTRAAPSTRVLYRVFRPIKIGIEKFD